MRYSNRESPTYWEDFMPPFRRLIIRQVLEWIGVAIVGGAVVGVVSALLYRRFQQRSLKKTRTTEEQHTTP
jgi:membrane protein implicated in regulation of membrane protease activity